MPAFNVVSSINIDAPTSRVRDVLADYETWPSWSPWLIMEPDSKLTYKGTAGELGHGYDWSGDKVGAGGMTTTALDANRMESDLRFLKPFKSQADVAFDFESVGDNETKVTWYMDSSLPFFMFFMVNKMKAMIGMDYDRGLRMLKDYVEKGSVPSGVSVEGIVDVPAVTYAGTRHNTSMDNISDSMAKAFHSVYEATSQSGAEMIGMPFSIYNNMDIVSGSCAYTAAIPIANSNSAISGASVAERPACKALKIVHTGPYRHLGNAWATGMSDMRHGKMKPNKQVPPFEVYVNDPDETAESALITEVYMPVR